MEDPRDSNSNPPWIELLDSLVEIIIEKLQLLDYIRFGAICKRWHLIQKEHGLRYSPKPPPMAPSVVLAGHNSGLSEQLLLHLPFKENKIRLSMPYFSKVLILDSCCGWILTYDLTLHTSFDYFRIWNPISGVIVQLPQFPTQVHDADIYGSMSAPQTDPNCCVIMSTPSNVFLLRLRDNIWLKVEGTRRLDSFWACSRYVYAKGKFYRISNRTQKSNYAVDPFLSKPLEQNLEFDIEDLIEYEGKFRELVAIDGELFIVIHIIKNNRKAFLVFRASFTMKKWIRANSIGKFAILLSNSAISLPVNSSEGFKKNMIYFNLAVELGYSKLMHRAPWMAFDIDTEELTQEQSLLHEKDEYEIHSSVRFFWFFPHL